MKPRLIILCLLVNGLLVASLLWIVPHWNSANKSHRANAILTEILGKDYETVKVEKFAADEGVVFGDSSYA